ncbi:MAG: Arginine-tRNA ligase [Parcubacteria group bacterium GW2011_GWC2_39_14]|nr:MAG: Arginine-tRNA ligase [Parcubacteria group bacterium GW2011_GWC2_39_14]KKR55502.1 MAG: Arginine-tRNA ligase [Parcubacteria group bacterium GW2011_GWA2_40_23]
MIDIKTQLSREIGKIVNLAVSAMDFAAPPNVNLGDLAFPCFNLAKELKTNPNEVANNIAEKLSSSKIVSSCKAAGPYVNIIVKDEALINLLSENILANEQFGVGQDKKTKLMVEFAHPNTLKSFHIGHLRNIVTGESIARILQNDGYEVVRANYQGDVGLHIPKALWGIKQLWGEYESIKKASVEKRVAFLGKAYAFGSQNFEKDEAVKTQVYELNEKIYKLSPDIEELYQETRTWSLEYFDHIYARVDTKFDRLYFESETFKRGKEIVEKFIKKGIFEKSEGAIIFPGEKFGLHNRVFISSKGAPMYEAKDIALAEMQFKEFNPKKIIHVVGKEQTEYFKVIFEALSQVFPKLKGREFHLAYGWVSLKHGKMSSRTGQVVLGEWLLDEVEKQVQEIMKDSDIKKKDATISAVSLAAVKYALLKVGVKIDLAFDINESVSLSGDSGPYLLYINARINSILAKASGKIVGRKLGIDTIHSSEKKIIMSLSNFAEATEKAADELDPSVIARYLFNLAQDFNTFYAECPVLQAEEKIKIWRLQIITAVRDVMNSGLNLLGIPVVEKM